jgi:hypothetical protein
MHIGIVVMSATQLAAVYALLGGASPAAVATGNVAAAPKYVPNTGDRPETVAAPEPTSTPKNSTEPSEDTNSGNSTSDEIDAHGWPWSADLHASTKGQTKDGLWRMKVGVTRPDPKPGFPIEGASPASPDAVTATEPAGSSQTQAPESAPASQDGSPAAGDDEDEFAAFHAAAAKSEAQDEAAKANIPARKWTDADLGALCNQAAVKLGDPAPIKAIIEQFVTAGEVPHSRNIPDDKRAEFAAAVEAKAGIEFAG